MLIDLPAVLQFDAWTPYAAATLYSQLHHQPDNLSSMFGYNIPNLVFPTTVECLARNGHSGLISATTRPTNNQGHNYLDLDSKLPSLVRQY